MLAKTDIAVDGYLRERLDPRPGDSLYLHLSDLRLALERCRPAGPLRVLDYGCGGSPYESLFPGAPYHRADFAGMPRLDFTLAEDSAVAAPSGAYDLVLSTQVLEHVAQPATYLGECHRLLAPGGRLVLSTHGIFQDHGCPYDYQRWTSDGLKLALTRAGFEVLTLRKLTCGARALFFLARTHQAELVTRDRTLPSWGLRLVQRWLHNRPALVDRFCDRAFPADRRVCEVPAGHSGPPVYIALLAEARKARPAAA